VGVDKLLEEHHACDGCHLFSGSDHRFDKTCLRIPCEVYLDLPEPEPGQSLVGLRVPDIDPLEDHGVNRPRRKSDQELGNPLVHEIDEAGTEVLYRLVLDIVRVEFEPLILELRGHRGCPVGVCRSERARGIPDEEAEGEVPCHLRILGTFEQVGSPVLPPQVILLIFRPDLPGRLVDLAGIDLVVHCSFIGELLEVIEESLPVVFRDTSLDDLDAPFPLLFKGKDLYLRHGTHSHEGSPSRRTIGIVTVPASPCTVISPWSFSP